MPDPRFTRPDLCSIPAADAEAEPAGAVRGGLSADRHLLADDDPPAPLATGIDRAIRLSTAAAVLAVAGIAAYVSYWHAYAVVRAHGETGITARLEPATIDGLVYASSMCSCCTPPGTGCQSPPSPAGCSRWESPLPSRRTWPRAGPTVWSGRWSRPGRRSAWWGRTSFLVWLIRTCGAADRRPSAAHLCTGAACRTAARPVPASAVDGEHPGGNQRGTSDLAWRPAGQPAGQPPVPAGGQRDDEALEASAGDDAAVAAYRLSPLWCPGPRTWSAG